MNEIKLFDECAERFELIFVGLELVRSFFSENLDQRLENAFEVYVEPSIYISQTQEVTQFAFGDRLVLFVVNKCCAHFPLLVHLDG